MGGYRVTIETENGTTHVEIEAESDRRFPLGRLIQWVAAARYQEAAYEAQGYAVVEQERSLGV